MLDLIMAEMAEQATWATDIPAWHPRNEGDDSGSEDAGGAGGEGSGGNTGDEGSDDEGQKDAAQAAVDAAYAKLREAEKERDQFKAQATKLSRAGMEENERLKAEAEDARNEAAALQERLDAIERSSAVERIARTMNFRKPDIATKFVPDEATDEKSIRAALKDAIKDIPELVSNGAAPPPVNDGGKAGGSMNDRMNNALRAAAGRTRA